MIFKTFRARFVFVSASAVCLLMITAGSLVYFLHGKKLMGDIDASLLSIVKTVAGGGETAEPGVSVELLRVVNDEFYQVITRQGRVTIAYLDSNYPWPVNRGLIGSALKGMPQYETVHYKSENYRLVYYPLDSTTVLRARKSQEGYDRAVGELGRLLLFSFPPLLIVSMMLGWIFAGKMLDPFRRMNALAEQIRQGSWDNQLTLESYGREINELGLMLNDMVGNIKRSMESQKRFTADVSHEIRSPLTSLRGTIEVALRKKRTPEEYEEVLRSNLTDVIRLTRLTDNLLFLSKADHKILALRRHWFDVRHMLETVVEGVRDKALREGVAIHEDYQHDVELNGDLELLEHAFSNIIDNAIKYTPRGGSIAVMSRAESDIVKISVSDTGIGIPEDQIPHIFDRFYRVDREQSRRPGGTGLGLAITRWIIKAHNGEISVASAVDRGSEFTVTMPKMTEAGM